MEPTLVHGGDLPTTKATGNVFADLGSAPLESASLQLQARLMAGTRGRTRDRALSRFRDR